MSTPSAPKSPALPRLAVTLGDVAGIGPEIVASALSNPEITSRCSPTVIGHPEVLGRALRLLNLPQSVSEINSPDVPRPDSSKLHCWNPSDVAAELVPPGQIDPRAGHAACDWLVAATQATLAGHFDAIVTAPINKYSLRAAGIDFPGHTEILASQCGISKVAMMLYLPPGPFLPSAKGLSIAHVTLHTSIASVPGLLSTSKILDTIQLVDSFLNRLGRVDPPIGVAALNPHAGEQGLFGNEEAALIAPAVAAAQQQAINAHGPFPADTLILRATRGEFEGVVAMYHDQGHIPIKLLAFHRAVNITLGLPILRTSPTHGTAFDIAWKNLARPDGLIEALHTACRLTSPR